MSKQKEINPKVMMYHRVVEEPCKSVYSVHAEDFRRQLSMLQKLNYIPITFEDYSLYLKGKLTLPKKPVIITFDDGHLDTYTTAFPILQEFDMKAVVFVMGNRSMKYADWDGQESEKTPLMTDDQIVEMREAGFEIGAHSMTHAPLSTLSTTELIWEISQSKKNIEELLNEKICSFAYPYGRVNSLVQSVVVQEGFQFGCGVYTGPPMFESSFYDIRRLTVYAGTKTAPFLLKLLTPYQYAEWIYGKFVHKPESAEPAASPGKSKTIVEYDLESPQP